MNNHQNNAVGFPPSHPTAINGYPYAGLPPRPAYYYNYNNQDQANPNMYYYHAAYASQRTTFYRRFVSTVIAVLVILASILFIVWLVLRLTRGLEISRDSWFRKGGYKELNFHQEFQFDGELICKSNDFQIC